MDKFYCKKRKPEQIISGWATIIAWLICILLILFSEHDLIPGLVNASWITLFWLSFKIREYYSRSEANVPYILFGKKALFCQQADKTKWYIDYSRLKSVSKIPAETKGFAPRMEEILFTTNDGDSYVISHYTLKDQQIRAIQERIDKITSHSKSHLTVC